MYMSFIAMPAWAIFSPFGKVILATRLLVYIAYHIHFVILDVLVLEASIIS